MPTNPKLEPLMNAATSTALATLRPLREVVAEYDAKRGALLDAIKTLELAITATRSSASIGGAYGGTLFRHAPNVDLAKAQQVLLKSAWRHVYEGLNVDRLASPRDRSRFSMALESPAPFTIDNIAATFGDYVKRPRHHILRGLAEVFSDLDQAYKSHDKVKVGVTGLPKRVIIDGFGSNHDHGRERLTSVINAIRTFRGLPNASVADIEAMIQVGQLDDMNLKTFRNGNGHLFFGPEALLDINRALAEFYGDVLADTPDERPAKRMSTAVAKDLQFYPTPRPIVADIVRGMMRIKGASVLEPSCGDGRMMEAVRKAGAGRIVGVEVDAQRVEMARARGLSVVQANFLEMADDPTFDFVLMNPPFYGTHYAKHVSHACRFLVPRGQLIAILPITARIDHGLLTHDWAAAHGMRLDGFRDLPVGSFEESGTNINTTVFTATKKG